jgi:hypothetical protein
MTMYHKQTHPAFVLMLVLAATACAPLAPASSTPQAASPPAAPVGMQPPAVVAPTETLPPASLKPYTNSTFGLSFQYPATWFGPDEYVSGGTLRVAVGSDQVQPYGADQPEQPSEVRNSYLVVVQYSKNSQDDSWKDTWSFLTGLKDGESLSGPRSLVTRVGQLDLGRFKGFEFITTLSGSAQTDHVYSREALLVDEQSNLLTIFGTPNNVEVGSGADWREVFRSLDEANLPFFHAIMESIQIK